MPAIRFVCKVNKKANHEEIKRMLYVSRGAIMREKIIRDTSTAFESEMEMMSEGGTLYRQVKELGLAESIYIRE
jgi:hypothetical protein